LNGFDNYRVVSFVENRYTTSFYNKAGFGFAMPFRKGGLGLSFVISGDKEYREYNPAFSCSLPLAKKINLGFRLGLTDIHAAGYDDIISFSPEISITAQPSKEIKLATRIIDPYQLTIGPSDYQRPWQMISGLSWTPDKHAEIMVQLSKAGFYPFTFCAGVNLKTSSLIVLRSGVQLFDGYLNPSLGVGLNIRNVGLDIASQWNSWLGFSGSAGICWRLRK
jgi:hypothetical protein